jgi:hypothetical protein
LEQEKPYCSISAERGLAPKWVPIWLYEGRLHIAYWQTLLV